MLDTVIKNGDNYRRNMAQQPNKYCYIARVNTSVICGHVALDKCNVSRLATSEKLLCQNKKNVKEKKQVARYAAD